MEKATLDKFSVFLQNYKRKNGKKLGSRTILGILTMAKFIPEIGENVNLDGLRKHFRDYLSARNHPMAKEALSLYLKWLNYDSETIRQVVKFERQLTAVTDEEKLAESVLSIKEINTLVAQIPNERDRLLIRLLYDTAARISEICGAKLADIDFEKRQVRVLGKGRKPRQVFFYPQTAEILKQWIKKNRLKLDNSIFDITPATAWANFKNYGKKFLGRELRPHMFRHSRLQHMADYGVDALGIKAYAGHEDLKTTQIYVKSSEHQRKLAFEKAKNPWES